MELNKETLKNLEENVDEIKNEIDEEEINYEVLSDNPKVVEMLKQKIKLEKKIQELDEFALVLLELQILAID